MLLKSTIYSVDLTEPASRVSYGRGFQLKPALASSLFFSTSLAISLGLGVKMLPRLASWMQATGGGDIDEFPVASLALAPCLAGRWVPGHSRPTSSRAPPGSNVKQAVAYCDLITPTHVITVHWTVKPGESRRWAEDNHNPLPPKKGALNASIWICSANTHS